MVHWLGLSTFPAVSLSSISGRGIKIPQAGRCSQKKKEKRAGPVVLFLAPCLVSFPSSPTIPSLFLSQLHRAPCCSLSTKHTPASGPLHLLLPLPGEPHVTTQISPLTSIPFLWPLLGCLTNRLVSNKVSNTCTDPLQPSFPKSFSAANSTNCVLSTYHWRVCFLLLECNFCEGEDLS